MSRPPRTIHAAVARSASGFSLIEMLVALVISMIIASAMASLFARSIGSRTQIDREGQKIEGGRYALDTIADDLRLAGFYGDYMPRSDTGVAWPASSTTAATWTAPQPCTTTVASLGWGNSGTVNVPVHIMGYEAHPAVKTDPAVALPTALTTCLPDYRSGTDVVAIRRVSTAEFAPGDAAADTGEVFLQGSNCVSSIDGGLPFIVGAKASGGSNFNLHQLNCTTLSKIRKYVVRIYYVANCDVCSPSDNTPTLKVSELVYSSGSLQIVARSLAPGIENLHLEYGVDTTGDGASDNVRLSNDDPIGSSPGFNWQDVMSVKAYVLVRDLETTAGYTDSNEYVLGSRTTVAANDARKRSVFASTVRLVNPSGAREIP